ncbi:MAG: pantoate--beta-alanine ligase [Nitrosomonadaceae bacterium]|nr:pantoate--beta-alanine ligase [Nitrosospira sp.]MDW7565205.1 pantoate--beta-alanine ligase [Nitrosomonadaceae bacterium]MBI0409178.1 pantoate--beta-alanine ligase [Nitrosospira sp.]MBI0410073.1 pantoate--beta-alanine ligase [Nitrosospira sp.]MBI0411179.1 pantoate--beta-alanine ligase [Nitrosospira sp.]
MEIITDISTLRARLQCESEIAFVPTMGGLHEGHLSLVQRAQQEADCVVASIFVNRLQFAPTEDFAQYPRTLEDDCKLLKKQGVNVVFAPDDKDIYSVQQDFLIEPSPLANTLEGEFRPDFFRGVMTVILKLFNIVQPQVAVFGKKDYQQMQLVREMVRQMNLPLKVIACETTRAPDGLALSSRNRYLSNEERIEAARLFRVLSEIKRAAESGNRDFRQLCKDARENLTGHQWQVDYIGLHQRDTLAPAGVGDLDLVALAAARLGKTRLIDSLEISVKH